MKGSTILLNLPSASSTNTWVTFASAAALVPAIGSAISTEGTITNALSVSCGDCNAFVDTFRPLDSSNCVKSTLVSSIPSGVRVADSANVKRAAACWWSWCYIIAMELEHLWERRDRNQIWSLTRTCGWGELTASLNPSARRGTYKVGVLGTMLSSPGSS